MGTVDWARACQPDGRKRLAHLRRLAEIRHAEPSVAEGTMVWQTSGEKVLDCHSRHGGSVSFG